MKAMNEYRLTERAGGMLGLCARARKLITGEKAVVQAIRSGECHAAILDEATAANGKKAVVQACQTHGAPLLWAPEGSLGRAIGRPGRMAAAVTDAGMAGRLIELSEPTEA